MTNTKSPKNQFYCPLSSYILWWHNLEFKECPLIPSHRDMPECKNCKLKVDVKWDGPKEKWKEADQYDVPLSIWNKHKTKKQKKKNV